MDLVDGEAEASTKKRGHSSSMGSRKRVRFAPALEFRTYSLVLGDHPMCEDGLAIELGWEYDPEPSIVDLELHEELRCQIYHRWVDHHHFCDSDHVAAATIISDDDHSFCCNRRSYLERKSLLLNVAGCSAEELRERTMDYL